MHFSTDFLQLIFAHHSSHLQVAFHLLPNLLITVDNWHARDLMNAA